MTFRDPELQRVVKRNEWICAPDDDLQLVAGLFAAIDWFRVLEGEHSPRFLEAIEILLLIEMRPSVRKWYLRNSEGLNPVARSFREKLSSLAGEQF